MSPLLHSFFLSCFPSHFLFFFFFNDTATTDIYTLSLHDALPILLQDRITPAPGDPRAAPCDLKATQGHVVKLDRKSTRLNSSHITISYAVFCLKKKKKISLII